MNILVTGAKGFVGRNLVETLKTIRDGKNRTRNLVIGEIYEFDLDTDAALLSEYCRKADFVFNLAGVNRPQNQEEFMQGNFGFASALLEELKVCGNHCPVMLASSIQASLIGRYDGEYGRSKKAGEQLFFAYGEETGAPVLVVQIQGIFHVAHRGVGQCVLINNIGNTGGLQGFCQQLQQTAFYNPLVRNHQDSGDTFRL
jgi:UDP-2-acetamido-2,6-beta-L-arabino-hexul-4-ose reductase